ncbi:P2-like prophage tail protein X [Thiothrix eikelboomii]|uniref:p2-like prophage tail protein X n=1 Tax=Thiothrix eikelboomii TaxID=92487 RepID=A0A1T4WWY3_9GAMM|nr:tail protein X [Thiothrix eikelboomii]SKA81395.1 P2-like prophage tail protein X [Thiothrix eikelboomii]
MRTYTTQDGDVLDALCYAEYGAEHGTTEAVLAVNPILAQHPAVLPAGVVILLPDLQSSSPVKTQVQLWD